MDQIESATQFIDTCQSKFLHSPRDKRKRIICVTPESLVQLDPAASQTLKKLRLLSYAGIGLVMTYQKYRQKKARSELMSVTKFFLSPDFAQRHLKFDISHPMENTVYMENLCLPGTYVLPDQINERLAQEKMAAFQRIAHALGAKSIVIESVDASQTRKKIKGTIPIANIAAQIGVEGLSVVDGKAQRSLYCEFNKPERVPHFPEELRIWTIMEPTLRALVDHCLQGSVKQYKLSLEFKDVIQNAMDIKLKCEKLNINAGGEYKTVIDSRWFFNIEFW